MANMVNGYGLRTAKMTSPLLLLLGTVLTLLTITLVEYSARHKTVAMLFTFRDAKPLTSISTSPLCQIFSVFSDRILQIQSLIPYENLFRNAAVDF